MDENFNLPDGSYSVSDIQDYFEFIIKKHETIADNNPPIRIYINKIKNRIVFKVKTGYKLELLSTETMSFIGDGPIINTNKNGINILKLEVVNTVLVHCNIVQNNYQQAVKFCTLIFVPNKTFGQLINIHPGSLIKLKTTDSELTI